MPTVKLLNENPDLLRALADRRGRWRGGKPALVAVGTRTEVDTGGRRVSDGLQEKVEQTIHDSLRRDRADHILRTLTAVGIYLLIAGVGFVGHEVWSLAKEAPKVSMILQQNSDALTRLTDAQQRQDRAVASLDGGQVALREEVARLQAQIASAQSRLQEIERALTRRGVL